MEKTLSKQHAAWVLSELDRCFTSFLMLFVAGIPVSVSAEPGAYYALWPYDGANGNPVDLTKYVFANTPAEICSMRSAEMRQMSPYKPGSDWCGSVKEMALGLNQSNQCSIVYELAFTPACGDPTPRTITYPFFSPGYATCSQIAQWNPAIHKPYDICGGYFVTAVPPPQAQCDSCANNSVGHPINPATGAMFDTVTDGLSAAALPFKRFFNSLDVGSADISRGWHHAYSRNVQIKYSTIANQTYLQSAGTSSQYADPATACTSGFAEIQAQVPQWSGAIASYSGGNCQLTSNGVSIGSLTVYSTGSSLAQGSTPVAFDVIRDDGQLIRFTVNNSVITAPPGISLQLTQTASGFTVTDANNNVEQYDTGGRLLNVVSRAGVAQTMSYDSLGRLSSVTDSFSHQLTLSYDAQGRLVTVTRQ